MDTSTSRRSFVAAAAGGAALTAAAAAVSIGSSMASAKESTVTMSKINDMFAGRGNARLVTDDIWWVGAADKRIALFENIYPLKQGMTYNSYLIMDEKVCLLDTVDRAVVGQFLENINAVLDGRDIDYLVVNHMEPDHSAAIDVIINRFPNIKILGSAMAGRLINQFFETDVSDRFTTVKEGDTLELGTHKLQFIEAPMVHWPEVIMSYDTTAGVLFSADAFGSFNSLDGNIFADQVDYDHDWMPEARRFICNVGGKYGTQIQSVLDKVDKLDINYICSVHSLVWRRDHEKIIDKYRHWANYEPEDQDVVIYYGSIYGGTENAANILATKLSEHGVTNVKTYDVSKTHKSYLLAEAFRASHLVFCSATYNMGIFTPMRDLLNFLVDHNMQNRHVAFIENGSWQPVAASLMHNLVAQMPNMTQVGEDVTLLSTTAAKNIEELDVLAQALAASVGGDDSGDSAVTQQAGTVNAASGNYMHSKPDTAPNKAASSATDTDSHASTAHGHGSAASEAGASAGAASAADSSGSSSGTLRKFKCKICGYVYETDGDLPADFKCPLCGAPASMFEEITE